MMKNPRRKYKVEECSSKLVKIVEKKINISVPLTEGLLFLSFATKDGIEYLEMGNEGYKSLVRKLLEQEYGREYLFHEIEDGSIKFEPKGRDGFLKSWGLLKCNAVVYLKK